MSILQQTAAISPLVGDVQQVGVCGEGRVAALALRDSDTLGLCVGDQLGAAVEVPLPPRRDHLDVRLQPIVPAQTVALLRCTSLPKPSGLRAMNRAAIHAE